ncbi:hypothetical protein EEB18_002345 [Sphingopyxis sp. OPL5]|uniref:hypothetical protein n=1 Tax=Sphingopyxis sp. OPL5 TaxID=2486273 RepID=UPI00164D2E33|nr:hypothetical protein [Sphingopyxis sp. OPL5]QNO27843.1 hypothetical protein EEB18_002345 [Sphingopyxis sp. OPL5]
MGTSQGKKLGGRKAVGGGVNFQAAVTAIVAVYILRGTPLGWPSILKYRDRAHGFTRGRLIVRRAHRASTVDDFEDMPTYVRTY